MKKYLINTTIAACCMGCIATACTDSIKEENLLTDPECLATMSEEVELTAANTLKWNFADLNGWVLANQGNDYVDHSSIVNHAECEDGKALKIYTQAYSQQRKKVKTVQQYGAGLYTWRTYISDLGEVERASIGSWLYHNDEHELDFEVGSGTSEERAELRAAADEVIAYMTSQANPWVHQKVKIKKNAWHIFQIDLKLVNGRYYATWLIDGVAYTERQLNFGEEYLFHIFCSVENLTFTGDIWPTQDNYGLWDYVIYSPDHTQPGTGETITWDFENNTIPTGWSPRTNVGSDGGAYYSVQNGQLNLSNDGYCTTANLEYNQPVGYGKYTWRVQLPQLAGAERFTSGGTLYTSNENNGYHTVSITGWYGPEADRNRLGATGNQLLLRIYSEVPYIDTNVAVVNPNTNYDLSIELSETNGRYAITWLLNNQPVYISATTYGPDLVKFLLITSTESDRTWMPGNNITQRYTSKFNYIQYTPY